MLSGWRAVRDLGACLAPGEGLGPQLQRRIDEGDVDWARLVEIAGAAWVTPALAAALDRKVGLGRLELPEDLGAYLAEVRRLNRARNAALRDELHAVARRLNRLGIEPVLLKGAIALLPGQYPGSVDRVVGDLDLLLPGEALPAAFADLQTIGYRCAPGVEPDPTASAHHHAPPLLHPERPVTVELHREVLGVPWWRFLPASIVRERSRPLRWEGVTLCLPDPTVQVLHNFAHTQLQDRRHSRRALALRPLLELAQLVAAYGVAIDWGWIEGRMDRRSARALAVYRGAARLLLGVPGRDAVPHSIPEGWVLLESLAALAQPPLRRVFHWRDRLGRLPRRLLTPSWYPMKIRAWRRGDPL